MSILTELKKLTKKKNATVVSQALPDSLDGSGSSGGGANVLTLYGGQNGETLWVYKDPECTQEYASYDEAFAAIKVASMIKIVMVESDTQNEYFYPSNASAYNEGAESVYVSVYTGANGLVDAYLWRQESGVPA